MSWFSKKPQLDQFLTQEGARKLLEMGEVCVNEMRLSGDITVTRDTFEEDMEKGARDLAKSIGLNYDGVVALGRDQDFLRRSHGSDVRTSATITLTFNLKDVEHIAGMSYAVANRRTEHTGQRSKQTEMGL